MSKKPNQDILIIENGGQVGTENKMAALQQELEQELEEAEMNEKHQAEEEEEELEMEQLEMEQQEEMAETAEMIEVN